MCSEAPCGLYTDVVVRINKENIDQEKHVIPNAVRDRLRKLHKSDAELSKNRVSDTLHVPKRLNNRDKVLLAIEYIKSGFNDRKACAFAGISRKQFIEMIEGDSELEVKKIVAENYLLYCASHALLNAVLEEIHLPITDDRGRIVERKHSLFYLQHFHPDLQERKLLEKLTVAEEDETERHDNLKKFGL